MDEENDCVGKEYYCGTGGEIGIKGRCYYYYYYY